MQPSTPFTAQPIPDTNTDTDLSPAPTTASPLAAGCQAGTVRLFRARGNGTLRAVPWLTGDARAVALWYQLQADQGASVPAIAQQAGVSRATVRRALWTLGLVESIEDGDLDELYDPDADELVLAGTSDEDE